MSNTSEFIRFCIVGLISSSIDAIVFYCISSVSSYYIALVSGYLIGLLFNYLLTVYWTFRQKPSAQNAIGVITAHLINLFVVRMGLMHLFINLICMTDKIAYIPTVIISAILNFFMVKFVFSRK